MKQVKTLLVAALSLWSLAGFSQKSFKLPYVMHSHNDYEQPIPFWTAYYAGAGSIEADIYLEYGDILVAHDREDIHPSRSLRSLYLDPIQSLLKKHNGWLSADTSYKLQLLIDLKSPTNPCIDSLVAILERYPDIIRSKQIQIVLSGSRPKPEDFHRYPEYILYDGRPDEVYPANISHRVPIISESFRSITKWNGYGVLTAADKEKLVKIINETHAKGKKIRFWGAPDFINAWYELGKLGIDFMNTDNLHELSKFMARFQQTSFRNTANAGAIYKPTYKSDGSKKPAKNVILLIGDGMGLAHIHAGYTGNFANLNLYNFKNIGVSKTHAYDAYITDSAPGSSAFSTGVKTNNRAIGVDHTGAAVPLLPVFMKEKGKKNIIVATGDITDATPADFYAHQSERNSNLAIVRDLANEPIDLLIGAPSKGEEEIIREMPQYKIAHSITELPEGTNDRWVVLDKKAGLSMPKGRGTWAVDAFKRSIQYASKNKNGFFMMQEGTQIDDGAHGNNMTHVVTEMIDFDQVIRAALEFADQDGETLVIVTADHETGGLTLVNGDLATGQVSGHFSTKDHTATPVLVWAYGPRSYLFNGVYENTAINQKIKAAVTR